MQVDWITVIAQIVNFAVLVALLRHFLYRPILNAMDRREQAIAGRVAAAEAKEAEAQRVSERLRDEWAALEASRDAYLEDARREASMVRDQLLEDGRLEVAETRERWRSELRREEESFLAQLRQETAQQVEKLGRRILGDLAGAEFETALVDRFLKRLEDLQESTLREVSPSSSSEVATVHLSFEPENRLRGRITLGVRRQFGERVDVRFEHDPELLCGIALHINGRRLAWSVDQYLAEVEESVANLLAEAAPPASAKDRAGA